MNTELGNSTYTGYTPGRGKIVPRYTPGIEKIVPRNYTPGIGKIFTLLV